MRYIVYSSTRRVENETHLVTEMFRSGLDCFHLKRTNWSNQTTIEFIQAIPEEFRNRIVLYSHFKLAVRFGLKGVHVPRNGKLKGALIRLYARFLKNRNPFLKISSTFRRLSHLRETDDFLDYVMLGPLYDNKSSQKNRIRFGEQEIEYALLETDYNVYGFGGIQYDKIDSILNKGFEGIALSNLIWNSENPLKAFRSLKYREGGMRRAS